MHRPSHPHPLRRPSEDGAVTAEAAVVIPTLVLVVLSLAWLLSIGVTQVRVVDAAREAARSAARSDSTAEAVALARRVAPAGSRVSVRRGEDEVVARVVAPVSGPGRLLRALSVEVSSEAVAAAEPTPGSS